MNKKRQTILFLVSDFLSAAIAWTLFFFARNEYIDAYYMEFPQHKGLVTMDINYVYGLCLVPFMWITLYYLSSSYKRVYRKSRLKEFINTLWVTILGSSILFFAIILEAETAFTL